MHDDTSPFDTNAELIGVDNRASGCASHNIKDFEGPVKEINWSNKGFGGARTWNVSVGTMAWK